MEDARFSRSCALVLLAVGGLCSGEPPFKIYGGTADLGLGP